MTIKMVNQYSVARARNSVRGSLQAHGEQVILLSMFHARDNVRRCPNCTNSAYSGGSAMCPICYGTGFQGGVKEARRVWALFSDHRNDENYTKRGVFTPDSREMQTEAFPELLEHDNVVRVRSWDPNFVPLELEGTYGIGQVVQDSLRTGARFGQYYWDVIGQRAPVTRLADNLKITDYPIVGRAFAPFEWTGIRATTSAIVQPDVPFRP